eukprot:SAG22_NODE_109_length_19706_cov_464.723772_11_plen_379_part_00
MSVAGAAVAGPPGQAAQMSKTQQRAKALESIRSILSEVFDVPAVLRRQKPASELSGLGGMVLANSLIFMRMATTTVALELDKRVVSAIYLRDMRGFTSAMTFKVAVALIQNLQWSGREWVSMRVALAWRQKLTRRIHDKYFDALNFYRLNTGDSSVDIEERLTNDVESACMRLSWQVSEVGESVLMTTYSCVRLGRISGAMTIAFCVFYSWFAIWLREAISPGIVQGKAVGNISKVSGEYRTVHSRLLQHAEAIVSYGGTEVEMARIKARSRAFFVEWRAMCLLSLRSSFTMMLQWMVMQQTVMSALVHVPYLSRAAKVVASSVPTDSERMQANATVLGDMQLKEMLLRDAMMQLSALTRMKRSLMMISGPCNRLAEL